jgi:hypothetical protein
MIREKAVHTVRVGEQEKTSVEMSEWLHPEEEKKSYWWTAALIVVIILVIFMVIYFLQNGLSQASAANQRSVSPQTAEPAYTLIK